LKVPSSKSTANNERLAIAVVAPIRASGNLFGALEFSEKLAGYGIQPIVGCALAVDFGDTDQPHT
jgi:DNA polymerase III alpha subunit